MVEITDQDIADAKEALEEFLETELYKARAQKDINRQLSSPATTPGFDLALIGLLKFILKSVQNAQIID